MEIIIISCVLAYSFVFFFVGRYWQKKYRPPRVEIVCERIVGKINQTSPILTIKGNVIVSLRGDICTGEHTSINVKTGELELTKFLTN